LDTSDSFPVLPFSLMACGPGQDARKFQSCTHTYIFRCSR
jgi:hypothetical protein